MLAGGGDGAAATEQAGHGVGPDSQFVSLRSHCLGCFLAYPKIGTAQVTHQYLS